MFIGDFTHKIDNPHNQIDRLQNKKSMLQNEKRQSQGELFSTNVGDDMQNTLIYWGLGRFFVESRQRKQMNRLKAG